jgi:hypothetical protein
MVSAPQFGREWEWNVGSISAGLSMEVDDGGAPMHTWFEFGTNPDLSGAAIVGDQQQRQGYGGIQSHATLGDLTPGTTYYYRAHVQTLAGAAAGPIQSFTTAAATAPQAPDVHFDNATLMMDGDQATWWFSFSANGHGLAGSVYMLRGTDPAMADATRYDPQGGAQTIEAGPTGQGCGMMIPNGLFPSGTTVYVQAVVTTAAGEARSNLGSTVLL